MAESFQDRIKEVSDERVLFAYLADGTFLNADGDDRFKHQIEKALNKKVGYAHRGRPRKPKLHE